MENLNGTFFIVCPGGGPDRKGRYARFPLCPTGMCGSYPMVRFKDNQPVELNCNQVPSNEIEQIAIFIISGPFPDDMLIAYNTDNNPIDTVKIRKCP